MVTADSTVEAGSRTSRTMGSLRNTPLFRSLIPMEAGIGWPIPTVPTGVGAAGRVWMRLPLFGMLPSHEPGVASVLYPPFATVSLDWQSLKIVEYVDLQAKGTWPSSVWERPAGTFPHPAVEGTTSDYTSLRNALLDRYDELFELINGDRQPSDEWVRGFGELLATVVEPDLLPYFRDLGPKFFEKYLGPGPGPGTVGSFRQQQRRDGRR